MKRHRKVVMWIAGSILFASLLIALGFWCIPGYRYYALDRAIVHGREFLVRLAIIGGADVNGRDYAVDVTPWEPNHPVLSAVFQRNPKLLALLLSKRGEVNFIWAEGYSPLWIAIQKGDAVCTKMLLDAGANPDLPTGMTPRTARELASKSPVLEIREMVGKRPNQ
jgi:hypothetical protein